jgi:addiction module HigA family antidote
MSVNALAIALGVPATRIHEIVKERRSITADTAERLARYFGGDAISWLSLQALYDVKTLSTREEIINRVQPRISEASVS